MTGCLPFLGLQCPEFSATEFPLSALERPRWRRALLFPAITCRCVVGQSPNAVQVLAGKPKIQPPPRVSSFAHAMPQKSSEKLRNDTVVPMCIGTILSPQLCQGQPVQPVKMVLGLLQYLSSSARPAVSRGLGSAPVYSREDADGGEAEARWLATASAMVVMLCRTLRALSGSGIFSP
jgi:hypothetical protein